MSPLSEEWMPFLRKVFFFSGFTEEELSRILSKTQLLSLPKGAVLFREGDEGDALYLVSSGRVRIVESERGQEKTVAYLGRGDTLGEVGLLTRETRANTALVDATAELLVLYKADFEELLRQAPSMAVQISRLLSARLLEAGRARSPGAAASKVYALSTHLPEDEALVFTINLALSLVEQTRRRVLLLDVLDKGSGPFARALGLEPVRIGEGMLRQEDLQSPDVLHRLTTAHPSGLELMSLPMPLVEGKLYGVLYPFLATLRKTYDIVLVALPPKTSTGARAILEDADTAVYLERDGGTPGDAEALQGLAALLPPEKIFRVMLMESAAAPGAPPVQFRMPWQAGLGAGLAKTRSPFLAQADPTAQRFMDRLARQLGGLRIGLAMGSGASLGYVIIGMLRVLEKNGIFPDVLAGTSMGALIGSFYAAGKDPDELEKIALSITKARLWSMADLTFPRQGLILGGRVLKFLKSVVGDVNFDELMTPFACVATDITNGEEVVLKRGRVAEAVRGSLSLPFFFQPFFHQGRYLVDGGLVNPVPTSVIASMGADVLISINLTTKPSEKRIPGMRRRRPRKTSFFKGPNIFEVLLKTLYTMQFGISQVRAEPAHVVLDPDLSAFTWAEFHKAGDIIKVGEDYMEAHLPKIKALLPFFSDYCKVPLRRPAPLSLY